MALIKCPECGKEISDKSTFCNGCGYPISSKNSKCNINGIIYDLSFVFENGRDNKIQSISTLIQISNCGLTEAKQVIEKILESQEIPKVLYLKSKQNNNQLKCPTCGSDKIKKISVSAKIGGAMMFGIFSKTAKSQFKCEKCGYKW